MTNEKTAESGSRTQQKNEKRNDKIENNEPQTFTSRREERHSNLKTDQLK